MLGKILKAAFPYMEYVSGADHSRLLCTSHTVPANKLKVGSQHDATP